MVRRRGLAMLVLASLAALPRPARAQYAFDWRAGIGLSATYTEMFTSGPFPTLGALTGPSFAVSPSFVMLHETPRFNQNLTYGLTLSIPVRLSATAAERPITYAQRLDYLYRVALSDRMDMTIDASANAVPNNSFVVSQNAAETPLQVTPQGFSYNLVFSGGESITRDLSPRDRATQSLDLTYGVPFQAGQVRASTFSVKNGLSVMREWPRDTGGLSFSTGYTHFSPSEGVTQNLDARDTFVNTLTATWRRLLTPDLSSRADLGVTQVISPTGETKQLVQPSGGAALEYNGDDALGTLSYAHAAQLNAFTASINIIDQVSIRGAYPFGVSGLSLIGSAGFLYSRPVTAQGTLQNGYLIWLGDVGLDYVPDSIPTLSVGLRGQLNQQSSLDDPNLDFTRLSVSLQVSYSYPNAKAANLAPRVNPAFVTPQRESAPGAGGAAEAEPAEGAPRGGAAPPPR